MSRTEDRILDLIKKDVVTARADDGLTVTSPLLENKILDSFGVIKLLLEIENEFSIALKPGDLNVETFGTVRDIASMVDAYVAGRR